MLVVSSKLELVCRNVMDFGGSQFPRIIQKLILGLKLFSFQIWVFKNSDKGYKIDATANTIFLPRGRNFPRKGGKPVDKQASGPHTNTLGREIKSPI